MPLTIPAAERMRPAGALALLALVLLPFVRRTAAASMELHPDYQACLAAQTTCTSLILNNQSLTGTIPTQLATLTSLSQLHLEYNQLSGTVPSAIAALPRLQEIVVCHNPGLCGDVPAGVTLEFRSAQCATATEGTRLGLACLQGSPSTSPTLAPSLSPTLAPSLYSTLAPSLYSTLAPSLYSTLAPSVSPSASFTTTPTAPQPSADTTLPGAPPLLSPSPFPPPSAPSPPPLSPRPPSAPSPPPPPPFAGVYVDATFHFPGINVSQIDIADVQTSFRTQFRASVAESAGLATHFVEILSIRSGEAVVVARAYFESDELESYLQMASRFFAVLHVEPEGIFTHADFRGYGVPEVSGVAVGPSDIPWEDSVVSCFPGVEYPQASQVKFAFYSPGADAFACQLDDRYVECASPYLTPHLQPGEHTFQVTPVHTQSRSEPPKQVVWTVSPHFQLEIDEDTLSTEVTIPQTARVDAAVSRTALAGALTCTVDPLRSSPGLLPSCEIMPSQAGVGLSQNSTLTVRVRTVNGIAGDEKGGNYTATMVISDAGEGLGIISKVEFFVKLRVNKQSTLLIFPGSTVHASSQGLVRKVIVGDTAQPEILQLLSLSNNITEFRVAKNFTVHEHSQTVERDIMELSESQGALTYSGDIRTIELDFFPAPTLLTGLFTQELVVSNMLDGSQQKILVSMMVIAGEISNRSAVAFSTERVDDMQAVQDRISNHTVTVGESVDFVISPVDRYGNRLGGGNLFVIQTYPAFANPVEAPQFQEGQGLYRGSATGIVRYGQYHIFVQLMGSDLNLDGSPLSLRAEKVRCDLDAHRVASEAGDVCQCTIGHAPNAFALSIDGGVDCLPCAVGTYSSSQTDDACASCPPTTSTLQAASTSESQCVCDVGYFFSDANTTQSCRACPAGTFAGRRNSSACELCPQGTKSLAQATDASQCVMCDDNFITEGPGAAECTLCSDPNAETRRNDHSKCWCKDGFYADFDTYFLGFNRTCKPCPDGGECYSDAIYGIEGYWRGSLSQETFYKCKEDVCLAETDQSSTPCVEGHKGMLCAACVDGYSMQGRACKPCFNPLQARASIVMAIVIGTLFLVLWVAGPLWFDAHAQLEKLSKKSRNKKQDNHNEATWMNLFDEILKILHLDIKRVHPEINDSQPVNELVHVVWFLQDQVKTLVKIYISFVQVALSVVDVYSIPWPPMVHSALARLQLFQFDFFTFPILSCVYPNPHYFVTFRMYMTFPLALSVFIYVEWWILNKRFGHTKEHDEQKKENDKVKNKLAAHALATWLFFLFLMYPALSAKVLKVFACDNINNVWYLAADLRVQCYTPEHRYEMLLAAIGVLVYPIGIPMLFLYLLHHNKVHDIAKYKETNLVILRCMQQSATDSNLNVKTSPPEDFRMENISLVDLTKVQTHLIQKVEKGPISKMFPEKVYAQFLDFKKAHPRSATSVSNSPQPPQKDNVEKAGNDLNHSTGSDGTPLVPASTKTELLLKLRIWAKDHPDGRKLCRLPRLRWALPEKYEDDENKKKSDYPTLEREALLRLGSVFEPFHTKCWWYEIFDLLRKLVLSGLMIFVVPGSAGQVALGLFISVVMVCVHIHYHPYYDSTQNRLSLLSLVQLALNMFVGLLYKVETVQDGSASSDVLASLIIFLSSLLLAIPLIEKLADNNSAGGKCLDSMYANKYSKFLDALVSMR